MTRDLRVSISGILLSLIADNLVALGIHSLVEGEMEGLGEVGISWGHGERVGI